MSEPVKQPGKKDTYPKSINDYTKGGLKLTVSSMSAGLCSQLQLRTSRLTLRGIAACLCLLSVAALFLGSFQLLGQSSSSPKQLKQGALATLQRISTRDKDLQKKISEAADEINQSLADKDTNYFLDDSRILPPSKGGKVFDHEQNAADKLANL